MISKALGHTTNYYDSYDAAGNLLSISKTDNLGVARSYKYDALNRPTAIVGLAGRLSTFKYDNADRPTRMEALSGASGFTHDAGKSLMSTTDPVGNRNVLAFDFLNRSPKTPASLAHSYDLNNQPTASGSVHVIQLISPIAHLSLSDYSKEAADHFRDLIEVYKNADVAGNPFAALAIFSISLDDLQITYSCRAFQTTRRVVRAIPMETALSTGVN